MISFEGQVFCRPTCAGRRLCQIKAEFLGVYQHREEFIFPRFLRDTEVEENSLQANKKKKNLYSHKKKLWITVFPLHNSWHEEGLNADEVIDV